MRTLRQFTWGKGKSAGRNSSGRITIFHRGGGAKRLQREIDVKRSTSAVGIVERIEYDPNRSSRIALVRWIEGVPLLSKRKCRTLDDFARPPKILEPPTAATSCGLFSFSSLPGKVDQRKAACLSPGLSVATAHVAVGLPSIIPPSKGQFFSALSSPKAKGETAPLPVFDFPRIAVAGAKPAFFAPRMREQVIEKNTFSLCEVRKWRTNCALWATHYIPVIKRQAALPWQNWKRQDTGGLVRAAEHNELKPKADQGSLLPSQVLAYALCSGQPSNKNASRSLVEASRFRSLPAKQIGEGPMDEAFKVNLDRAPFTYILASQQMEVGKMVMNYDSSNPPTSYERQFTHSQEGNSKPLGEIRIGTSVHDIECNPGQGAKMVRAAGTSAVIKQQIMVGGRLYCVLRMPSSSSKPKVKIEVLKQFDSRCRAVIGIASNPSHNARKLRKAGQSKWLGRRPVVRGVAMNPVDHPHGGGEGRTKGGRPSVSPWGKLTKARFKTVVAWRKRHVKIITD